MKTKNNKTELLNPEEGEDNLGDALGKRGTLVDSWAPRFCCISEQFHHESGDFRLENQLRKS